jgi:hypothetical protein
MVVPGGGDAEQESQKAPEAGASEESGKEWVAEADVADAEKLRERVSARWEALIDRDFDRAYKFQTPEYREGTSVSDYGFRMGRSTVRWHLAALKQVRYHTPTEAEALVDLDYSFALPGTDQIARTQGQFSDWWVYREGVWWHHESGDAIGAPPRGAP